MILKRKIYTLLFNSSYHKKTPQHSAYSLEIKAFKFMQLSGNQILNTTPSNLWEMLMDPVILAKIVPGISTLEKSGDNAYKSVLQIKMGPVSGSFSGNLQLDDIVEQKSFTLKAQQNSKIGNANADVKINIAPIDESQAEVNFNGDVKISGLLASMGQRVLGGVANTLTKQFFANLEKEINRRISQDV